MAELRPSLRVESLSALKQAGTQIAIVPGQLGVRQSLHFLNLRFPRNTVLVVCAFVIAVLAGPAGSSHHLDNVRLLADQPPGAAIEVEADAKRTRSDLDDAPAKKLAALIQAIRAEESRFQHFSATVRTTRFYHGSNGSIRDGAERRDLEPRQPPLLSTTLLQRQIIDGDRFQFTGEDLVEKSSGPQSLSRQTWVCNGTETVSVIEKNCVTKYVGRVEAPIMTPPHAWGLFHLAVNFPMSVYLAGTDAFKTHPKVGRQPREGGSIFEFYAAEAGVVDEDVVDGLSCAVVLVKRWYYTSDPPTHQYLWLAKDRNLHVVQSRTASLANGQEIPREESRVKSWRKVSDGVWLPEIVEVTEISPDSVKNKTTDRVVQRLTLDAMEWAPETEPKTFESPSIPEGLPTFSVDADRHLVDSPHQPRPATTPSSTSLDEILERLTLEENKYDPWEAIVVEKYALLNHGQSWEGATAGSVTRRRSLLSGIRRFTDSQRTSIDSRSNETGYKEQTIDDGGVVRSYSKTLNPKATQASTPSAMISYDLINSRVPVDRAHTLIFRDPRETSGRLSTFLKSGWYDKWNKYPMTVTYAGDEQIGELLCHKLKCDLMSNVFFLWLARDRNLIPIRHEWQEPRRHATLPSGISYVEELRELRPGVWRPNRVVNLSFQSFSREGLILGNLILQWRYDVTVESASLDPQFDDRIFSDLMVDAGTKVHLRGEHGKFLGDYEQTETGPVNVSAERLQELVDKAKRGQTPPAAQQAATPVKKPPLRPRGDSAVAALLDRLEQQNSGSYSDAWLMTMKEIIELGPDCVPELIEELDATDNDRMLRCLGFMLRAINDKRAVPALIRAIPRTLRKPGSDMGLSTIDPDLFKFAQQHELNPGQSDKHYGFSRPVREICGALRKLTGRQMDEQQIFGQFLAGMPPERRRARSRYFQVAKSWADWWEQNWDEFVQDRAYSRVNLSQPVSYSLPRQGETIGTLGTRSELVLQSVLDPQARQVFYDIDADVFGELPERWRDSAEIQSHMDEILVWAAQQGYDLMGTEYKASGDAKPVVALRGVGLQAWELDPARWKQDRNAVTLELLREEGRLAVGYLLRRERQKPSQVADPSATASFLVVTGERSPALIHVGVETHQARQRPGTFFQGDPDLNPIGSSTGRRFAIMYLGTTDERP